MLISTSSLLIPVSGVFRTISPEPAKGMVVGAGSLEDEVGWKELRVSFLTSQPPFTHIIMMVTICLLWNTSLRTLKNRPFLKARSIILKSYRFLKCNFQSNFIAHVSSCAYLQIWREQSHTRSLIWNPEAGFYPNSATFDTFATFRFVLFC